MTFTLNSLSVVAIVFSFVYILMIYLTNRKVPYAKYFLPVFVFIIILFNIYYYNSYLIQVSNEKYIKIKTPTEIVGIILFIPFVISGINWLIKRFELGAEHKILTTLIFIAFNILLLLLWMIVFTAVFLVLV
ncbi:hypothetical protein BG261_04760 [Floricoccus tropicus]|uniref:Uncharacterized protein n=1 Tax=Floricoccus tropicus TaxID=1859473 RepID=A0A1E8GLB8_9LACT|nr:hypothetical protein [Floricoccus tropicus]OFI48977.1 hypothetical protein BG261_04760 [Floricoccus tropicus]